MSQSGMLNNGGPLPPGAVGTLTGNVGGPVFPIANNINVFGAAPTAGGFQNITTTGNVNPGEVQFALNNIINLPDTDAAATQGIYEFNSVRFMHNRGTRNTFLGGNAGNFALTGTDSTGIGYNALNALTNGISNTAVGSGSMALNTTGTSNAAVGSLSLSVNTSGSNNAAFGTAALRDNTTGAQNTAVGDGALLRNTTGSTNTAIGYNSLSTATTAILNTAVGISSGLLLTTGTSNTLVGASAGRAITTGGSNVLLGSSAGLALTTGTFNVAVGQTALGSLTTGASNIGIGVGAGGAYTGAETDNIVIANLGVLGENDTIRIGDSAVQTNCYIGGINGVNVGAVASVVSINGDHLGTTTLTAGTNINVTAGAGIITISETVAPIINAYTSVAFPASPYTVLLTDYYISVNTLGGAITIRLPNAPTQYRLFIIKDRTGAAAANNITVTTVAGAANIDGATSYVMNTNYDSIQLLWNGGSYEIY